jgi:hypothetical protein
MGKAPKSPSRGLLGNAKTNTNKKTKNFQYSENHPEGDLGG